MILETVVTLTQHDLHKERMNGKRTLIQKLMIKDLLVIFGIHFFTKHRGTIITTKVYNKMRETKNCALKLIIFCLGTSFCGLLLTPSGAMVQRNGIKRNRQTYVT